MDHTVKKRAVQQTSSFKIYFDFLLTWHLFTFWFPGYPQDGCTKVKIEMQTWVESVSQVIISYDLVSISW